MIGAEDSFHGWTDLTPPQDGVGQYLDGLGIPDRRQSPPKISRKKKRKKKRVKRKKHRSPLLLPPLRDSNQIIEEREQRLQKLEMEERERNMEKKREREKERVLREIRMHAKCKQSTHKMLEQRQDDEKYRKQLLTIENLEIRRTKHNEHSSKNPDWIPNLKSHANNHHRAQKLRAIEHCKKLKSLIRDQQDTAPVFAYSKVLDVVRKEEADKQAIEEARKEEPALNHMRKKKYGRFVSEMFTPKPPVISKPFQSPRSIDFNGLKPPVLERSELQRIGNSNMRSVKTVEKQITSQRPVQYRNQHKPSDCRKHGIDNMRCAARLIKQPDLNPLPRPPSRSELRKHVISIAKKQIGNPGWDDQKLRLLANGGKFYKETETSLTALHSNSDAMIQAVNVKIALLRSLQNSVEQKP